MEDCPAPGREGQRRRGHLTAQNLDGTEKGKPGRILVGRQNGFVDEGADAETSREQRVKRPPYQFGCLEVQRTSNAAKMHFSLR